MSLNQQLQNILDQLQLLGSEGLLIAGALALLLTVRWRLSQLTLRFWVSAVLIGAYILGHSDTGLFFKEWVILDGLVLKIKNLLLVSTLLIVWFIRRPYQNAEFYFFLISGLIGALFMMQGQHFMIIYLGIELASFSSYFLTGARLKPKSSEAMLKYALFGGVTSSVMLYGLSWIYGASGSLLITDWVSHPFAEMGLLLFFAGLLFKASLVPFHLWVPSTYQEAPSDAVAFFSIVPKVSSFVLIYHVLEALPDQVYSIAVKLLIAVALVTVLWGTLTALPQIRLKRTIAYGAIAHSGFLLPMLLMGDSGLSAFTFYAVVYALMNIGAFYIIQFHEHEESKSTKFETLQGFGKVAPFFGASMVVFMIALTGLPPTAGFSAKLWLFSEVYQQYMLTQDRFWMIFMVIGIMTSALSLYYYFKLPMTYFLKESKKSFAPPTVTQVVAATIFAVLLLWIFIQPEILNSFVF